MSQSAAERAAQEIKAHIDEAAQKGAEKALKLQWGERTVNYYRATEKLLREYKRHRRIVEHPEDFPFFPQGRSHDISIAPPPGCGVVDKIEMAEIFVKARTEAFAEHARRWHLADIAISQFEGMEEFIVIRLYYFNEDVYGNDRGAGAKRYTFEEISQEIQKIGMERTPRTLHTWRAKLVREMTVMLFGTDGAVSVESHNAKAGESNAQT